MAGLIGGTGEYERQGHVGGAKIDPDDTYLTVTEAATKYRLHPKTIRKWIRCHVVYVGPLRTIRIRDSDMIDMQTPTRGEE